MSNKVERMYSKDKKATGRRAFQDSINIEEFRTKYRLNLARKYSRQYYTDKEGNPTEQKRISTGLSICPENLARLEQACSAIHFDLLANNFDPTLIKYGLAHLEVADAPKKQKSLLELYDWYCESKQNLVSKTYLELSLKGKYRSLIGKAIENVGENDAIAIRNYVVSHGSLEIAKNTLANLDKAFTLGVKHAEVTDNPFNDMAKEIKLSKKNKNANNYDDDNEDSDTRAFTIEEMNVIIENFESSKSRKHYTSIIKFLFWTGCRTGEAIALKWRDIKWNKEMIVFRRTYNYTLKIFKSTKTGVIRYFPLPKDSALWNLLKSLPQGDDDDIIFKSKEGKIISHAALARTWHGCNKLNYPGVINQLIQQGKVKEYLKLYATRHTFISHQINEYGIEPVVVAQWVGNGAMVTYNSYLERNKTRVPGYCDSDKQQTTTATDNSLNDLLANLTPEQIAKLKTLLSE